MREKIVGLIGGMGPEATVDLMRRVIKATPVEDDVNHIHMLVDNNPKVPSRIKALIERTGESPAPCMMQMARGLERQGADFLAIPCNTAHHYYGEVAVSVSIPIINMIQLAAETIKARQPEVTRVGLLASNAVQVIALYEPWFAESGIDVLYPGPDCQAYVMQLIRDVKAQRSTEAQVVHLESAARNLETQGAQAIIIACTELSLLFSEIKSDVPIYDTADLLANEIIRRAQGEN